MGTTPDLTRRNAEDTLLYSFPSSLTMPTLPTPNPLKYSHSSFEVCCWLRVRADDLPKITQCGEKKTFSSLKPARVAAWKQSRPSIWGDAAKEKDACCKEPEIIGHCLTLSYFFKMPAGGWGGGWGVEFHKLISFVETVGVDIFLCIYLTNSRSSLAHRGI